MNVVGTQWENVYWRNMIQGRDQWRGPATKKRDKKFKISQQRTISGFGEILLACAP